jgi:hypothetical protein
MEFPKRNQKKITKRNEILHLTKQNETKRNEISLFFEFRETSEISRNKLFVSLCFVFRETKKRMRNGNLTSESVFSVIFFYLIAKYCSYKFFVKLDYHSDLELFFLKRCAIP